MADGSKRPVCAVVGVGPGNGEAIARRFAADGYAIALMARRTELTAKLAAELPGAKAYACDVTEAASVEAAFAATRSDLGDVDALIYNAGSGVWGNVEEVKAEDLERSWRVNTLGLFLTAQQAIPAMRRKGQGAIMVVGATASRRGAAGAAAFAQSKMAQRALAESMARHLWPAGIHVALIVVDGVVGGAGHARAVRRPSGRFLHRSGRRRCYRRRPDQARPIRLEFRGRSPAVQGEMVSAGGAHASALRPNTANNSAGSLQSRLTRHPDRCAAWAKPATSNLRHVSVWMVSPSAKEKLSPATDTT